MAVLVFSGKSTVYHYPAGEKQPEDELTRCGITGKKRPLQSVDGEIPANFQPCDACSELDDKDSRLMGSW